MSTSERQPSLKGLSSPLWPIRYKPLPDELLSCWLVRLAHGHGLKVQTFCNLLFGNQYQVWNRDIDRLAPTWLLDALILHTGTPAAVARQTTLRVFEGVLYPTYRAAGHMDWVMVMQMYHRKRQGYGQQYCPACLASDSVPYFRKTWRLALKTFCANHMCQLLDRCWQCQAAVSFHRMDMGQAAWSEDGTPLSQCYACHCNLADGPRTPPLICDDEAFAKLKSIVCGLDKLSSGGRDHGLDPEVLSVFRHLVVLLMSKRRRVRLRQYMADRMGMDDPMPSLAQHPGRPSIESQPTEVRHALIQWATWLLCAPRERIAQACRDRALLYNHLLRDFDSSPQWYLDEVVTYAGHCYIASNGKRRRQSQDFNSC